MKARAGNASVATGFTLAVTKRVLLLTVIAAALAATSVSSETASAFSATNKDCWGSAEVPATLGSFVGGLPYVEFPSRRVWRASCYSSYDQVIKVRYRLWGYTRDAGWVVKADVTRTATVKPGYMVTMAGYSGNSPSKWISADVTITWQLTNGYLIGSSYLDYNATGDYRCNTLTMCGVFTDSQMGAIIQFVTPY